MKSRCQSEAAEEEKEEAAARLAAMTRLIAREMVKDTPEIQELARLMKVKSQDVVEAMEVFQHCDPYLKRRDVTFSPLLLPCTEVWRRFGNANTEDLASYADQLKEYFK